MNIKEIAFSDLNEAVNDQEALCIDVRTLEEYRQMSIEGFILKPLQNLDPDEIKEMMERGNKSRVYLLCRSGARSKKAAEILLSTGIQEVYNIEGGILAYSKNH